MTPLKQNIKDALLSGDFRRIEQLALENKKVLSLLISFTYDKEDVLCWRAAEALGRACGAVAKVDEAATRNIVQRLLWSMSEESGGIGWSAPEVLGEIVINNPVLCADVPPILLSFQEEENFLGGILRAIGRIAESGIAGAGCPSELAINSLQDKDPSVRGLALYALSKLMALDPGSKGRGNGHCDLMGIINNMTRDEGLFMIYEDLELKKSKVSDFALEVLKTLE